MTGRPPKPASRKLAEGDTRKIGAKKLAAQIAREPTTERGLPDCPDHLRGRARTAWNFWADALAVMEQDRRPDAMMLEGACVGYARAVECDLIVAKDGPVVEDSVIDEESGEKVVLKRKAHPAVAISRASWQQVHRFCTEFGLSPVSRTRLAIERHTDPTEDLAKLLLMPRPSKAV